MVGESTASTRVLMVGAFPVRALEGRICSKPASRATFSILLKYYSNCVSENVLAAGFVFVSTYLDGLDLELESGIFIGNDHGVGVQLERRQSPHVVNTLLNTALEGKRLALAQDDDDNLAGLEDSLDTDGEGHAGHLVDVIVEEARVGEDSVVGKGLDTGTAGQRGTGLVEGNVAILTDTGKEQIDAANGLDGVLVGDALGLEALGVTIENVDVGRVDVYVGEEVVPHE